MNEDQELSVDRQPTIHARIKADGSHAVIELDYLGKPVMDGDGANLIDDEGGTAWFVWEDFELVPTPPSLGGRPPAPEGADDPGWFALLEKAQANGREYADNGIAAGEKFPQESPLSGEWAGAIMPRDVVNMAAGRDDAIGIAKDFEVDQLCDAWEDGYNSAPWPGFQPGGFHPGDEVEILMGGEWVGPYTVTDGEGRSPQHLVLRGKNVFEHHNDAPHNIRRAS